MKILLVTGRLAENLVRKYGKGCDVHVCNIDVAAFITPELLGREGVDLSGYDLVLVPGLTAGAKWKEFEDEVGVTVRLGPIHAYDLQHVIPNIDKLELSHVIPACRLMEGIKAKETIDLVDGLESECEFMIGDVPVGGKSRMKVVAEVARFNTIDELLEKIEHYEESGADIVDIGIPLQFDSGFISKALKRAVSHTNLPVSVDTFSKKAIEIGVKCGVDMIMSISDTNLGALEVIEDQAVVVVHRDLEKLFELLNEVRKRTERVIADPVLDPPLGVADSIVRYIKFRSVDARTPLLFGVGNVTELSDCDSIGMNALLSFIAEEVGCNLLFTTEASPKTRGSVKELKIATYLSKAARLRESPPKDAGISLLALKEKIRYDTPPFPESFVKAQESGKFIRDPKGDFIIYISGGKIVCKHEKLTVVGERAKEIIDTVLRNDLVSRLDHAAYLGRELMKAEISLILDKNYVQDRDLNFGILYRKEN